MVTVNNEKWMGKTDPNGKAVYFREGTCLSTDTKPTEGWGNGSTMLEMDTGNVFIFDAENVTWREL